MTYINDVAIRRDSIIYHDVILRQSSAAYSIGRRDRRDNLYVVVCIMLNRVIVAYLNRCWGRSEISRLSRHRDVQPPNTLENKPNWTSR